jgi:cytochrome o ubiquinol oxidase subunit 1
LPDKQLAPLVLPALGGTVLAGVPLCIAGLLGQAGGLAANDAHVSALLDLEYDSSAELWNILSLAGHGLMALTVLAFAGLMLRTFTGSGEQAADNPYGGHTVEWSTSSPAPANNFEVLPTVASPSPVFDMTADGSVA